MCSSLVLRLVSEKEIKAAFGSCNMMRFSVDHWAVLGSERRNLTLRLGCAEQDQKPENHLK